MREKIFELVIDIDTLKKFGNLEKIPELGVPKPKILTYTRAHFEAEKWALIFETSEEDQLKNIHNPHQDAITVAGTKGGSERRIQRHRRTLNQ